MNQVVYTVHYLACEKEWGWHQEVSEIECTEIECTEVQMKVGSGKEYLYGIFLLFDICILCNYIKLDGIAKSYFRGV